MTYSAAIGKAIPCSILGLLGGGYLASLLLAVGLAFSSPSPRTDDWLSAPMAAFPLLAVALLMAAPVTLLVGCPLYAALLQRGRASVISVLLVVVVVAGAAGVLVDSAFGYLVALYGAAIGLVTHMAQRVRSKSSSNPAPVRGAT